MDQVTTSVVVGLVVRAHTQYRPTMPNGMASDNYLLRRKSQLPAIHR